VPGASVQLPKGAYWLNDEGSILRRQIELDGLGIIDLTRTSREAAEILEGGASGGVDIGLRTLVSLNRAVARPMARTSALYRITVRGEADAAQAFARDAHQEIRAARGETCELLVHPLRAPRSSGEAR